LRQTTTRLRPILRIRKSQDLRYAWGMISRCPDTRIQELVRCIISERRSQRGVLCGHRPGYGQAWAVRRASVAGKAHECISKNTDRDLPRRSSSISSSSMTSRWPTSAARAQRVLKRADRAIIEPYKLDSNKCISYLTMSTEASSRTSSSRFDNWFLAATSVKMCVLESFSAADGRTAFAPRSGNVTPDLEDLGKLTAEESPRIQTQSVKERNEKDGEEWRQFGREGDC